MDAKWVEEIINKINGVISGSPAADVEKNLRALLQGVFSRLELVSREEFEVQSQVLARTRAQLDQLAARLEAIEKQHKDRPTQPE